MKTNNASAEESMEGKLMDFGIPTTLLQYGATGFAAFLGVSAAFLLRTELGRDFVRPLAVVLCSIFMFFVVILVVVALESTRIVDTALSLIEADPKSFTILGQVNGPPEQENIKIVCEIHYPLFDLTSDRNLGQKLYEDQAVYHIRFSAGDFEAVKTINYANTTVDKKNKIRKCDLGRIDLIKPFSHDSGK